MNKYKLVALNDTKTMVNPISSKMMLSQLPVTEIAGKTWLIRVDLNGLTDGRIKAAAATTAHIIKNGGYAVLLSHNGQPKAYDETLSLASGTTLLEKALEAEGVTAKVNFCPYLIGEKVQAAAEELSPEAPVLLLENTRFSKEETSKNPDVVLDFAGRIVKDTHTDGVIIAGFSAMHRPHASVTGIAKATKEKGGKALLGIDAETEIKFIWDNVVTKPQKPYIGLLGGAKVSGEDGKLKFLHTLLPKMDAAVIGGALLYPFLAALYGEHAGKDPLEAIRKPGELEADIASARALLQQYRDKLILPTVLYDPEKPVNFIDVTKKERTDFVMRGISEEHLLQLFANLLERLGQVGSVIMNGTFSYTPTVTEGTYAALTFLDNMTVAHVITIAGGGDTEKAIKQKRKAGFKVRVTFTPTGGGAMLDLISNGTLPGIEALSDIN